ncbi:TonB-dependent receptor [Rhodanobacter glycinis]|uniref:TonB-dependent receptor n=1 Tax=Rhodanobacter glycinis TaxID=582702 RepID=A0A5B9E5S2_9GAMM|nr:TonB-dependent receptor [Rhodanobacter glycinis]QEE25831.1 TonB-dependent receptor [Rhodanobacter glycinis]
MNTHRFARQMLPAAIVAVLMSGTVCAQDSSATSTPTTSKAAQAARPQTAKTLDQVVVTGSASTGGVRQIDASYAITTLSADDIKDVAPSSTADLLKAVPSVWVEASGGQTGANVYVRGFPGAGDARFVTTELDGSPLYGSSGLSFMSTPDLFRLDDSIKRVEVLRGGPSPIFASGQPGATVNFIQKDGTDTPDGAGTLRATVGTEGFRRFDAYWGGEIAKDWYFAGGGFAREGDGVHDAQFQVNRGGQLEAILTRKFDNDNGSISFSARHTHDNDAFFTSSPMVSINGKLHRLDQFDPSSDTLLGNDLRHVSIETTPGNPPGTVNRDVAGGRGMNLSVFGSKFDWKFGDGWSVSNRANFVGGDVPTTALFNGSNPPQTISSYINDAVTRANGDPAVVAAGGMASGGSAVYTHGGQAVDPNQLVLETGLWTVQKHIRSFTDEVRVNKEIFDGNTLTAGAYFASYGTRDQWFLGNNVLTTLQNNARLIDVTLNNGAMVSHNGFSGPATYAFAEAWSGRNVAGYLSDEWVIGPWRLDAGVRLENQRANGRSENNSVVDLDGNPLTLYNNGASVLNGSYKDFHQSSTHASWTAGANYSFTPHTSAFVRINSGQLFPMFDDIQGGTPQIQTVKQYELGFKTENKYYSAYLTAFYNRFSDLPYQAFVQGPNGLVNVTLAGTTSAKGLEFEGALHPTENFELQLIGDYTNAHYDRYGDYSNNQVERQPRLQFRVTPSYFIPTSWGMARVYATYTHVGQRYGDLANQQILPSYYTIDVGAEMAMGDHWDLRLNGSNITNKLALTEGNNRVLSGTSTSNVIYGRSIFGRSWMLSALYSF